MAELNKSLNYSRDDVFIISVNTSADRIETIEGELYSNPEKIFELFGRINALYSKTHPYIKKSRKMDNRLIIIRNALYNKDFMRDLINKNNVKTNAHFIKVVDGLIQIYRDMTEDYTLGIFPKIEIEDTRAGVLKQR